MRVSIDKIQESPFKSLLILAVPIIFLLFFNETYMLLDTFFLTKLGNVVVISFGYIANVYYFINRSGKGLGRGVSSMIARLLGARDFENVNNIALHGLILIIVVTVLSQILFVLFGSTIMHIYVSNEEFTVINIFLQCTFLLMIFILLSEYLVEILNGQGDTRLSTIIMTLGIVLNCILDYLFIFPCKLGVLGASLGTCVSYIITTIIFLYIFLVRKENLVRFKISDFSFDWAIIREILANSIPIILDSLMVTLSGLLIMHSLKTFAPAITAVAFIIIIRIQMFLYTPIQGLSRACNIVVGYLFGAKRFKEATKQMNNSILFSFFMNGLIVLFLIVFFDVIVAFFTKQLYVVSEIRNILYIVIIDLIVFSVIFNSNQSLVAIGRSQNSLYSVFIKFFSIMGCVFLLCIMFKFGKLGVLLSFMLGDLIQSFYTYFIARYYISKAEKNSDTIG